MPDGRVLEQGHWAFVRLEIARQINSHEAASNIVLISDFSVIAGCDLKPAERRRCFEAVLKPAQKLLIVYVGLSVLVPLALTGPIGAS